VRLPPVLAAYGAAGPEVDIEIDTGTTAALVDAVLARRLEAAFVAGAVSHPELLAIPMVEEELVLVTAPWIAGLDKLAASAGLDPIKLILFRSGCSYRTRLEALLAERGITNARPPRVRHARWHHRLCRCRDRGDVAATRRRGESGKRR
jgi:DNA-binding transcriptional LysR family regulator